MDEIVQTFQSSFTPKGNLKFEPNEIRVRNMKIDKALHPDKIKGNWLGFLAGLDKEARAEWPIVRYILEKHIVPQMHQDMETKAYFKGSYVAPVEGVAGPASGTMDGIKKILDAGLAETDVTKKMHAVALSAAPSPTNSFDIMEEFADNVDEALAGTPITIYTSVKRVKAYLRDKRNTHGHDVNYVSGKITIDFDENKRIVGLPSMAGSDYIWATPDFNFLYLRKANGMKTPKVEESKREVFLMTDWYEAIGFGANPLVYVYKPA